MLGQQDQLPSPVPEQLRSHQMFDIEIKYGLLQVSRWAVAVGDPCPHQVSEGLGFLHSSARMLHRNISPEAIVINEQVGSRSRSRSRSRS